jgi:hypothetical protein
MALVQFVERVVARLQATPVDLSLLASEGGPASIFMGGAGVALFLHEAARLEGREDLLPVARAWCATARRWAESSSASAWSDLPFGFVQGDVGLSYVEALLGIGDGDAARVLAATERIERVATRIAELARPTELFGGAAGIVSATRCLEGRLPSGAEHDPSRTVLRGLRERMLTRVLERYAAALDPGPDDMLGFAHGIAGELWSLVALLGADHAVVRARLSELTGLAERDDEGLLYWLPRRETVDVPMMGTLCNGMAGHTLLWCEVAQRSQDAAAMELARQCAHSTAVLVSDSPTLCCGLTGQAVALHRYAERSGDRRYTRRADARLARAIRVVERPGDETPFLGVWQGVLGIALVALGRTHGERVVPCIEPLGLV